MDGPPDLQDTQAILGRMSRLRTSLGTNLARVLGSRTRQARSGDTGESVVPGEGAAAAVASKSHALHEKGIHFLFDLPCLEHPALSPPWTFF
jgi:hypothetical protein